MSIRAQISTDINGNITVYMKGGLDYENSLPLRLELETLVKTNPTSVITLDFDGVDFVGSSGIGHFVETVQTINTKEQSRLQLTNVTEEFKRVFGLYTQDVASLCIRESNFETDETRSLNIIHGGRGRTFEN